MLLDLATVKAQLRVTDSAEDALIGNYAEGAESYVLGILDRSVFATQDEVDAAILAGDTTAMLLNPRITNAILLAATDFYTYRDSGAQTDALSDRIARLVFVDRSGLGL